MLRSPSQEETVIFLSYAREDHAAVSGIYQRLRAAGFDPWMDTFNIIGGEEWERAISLAIAKSDLFLACLSPRSAGKRGVLQKEIQDAVAKWKEKLPGDVYLIPVRLEPCELPERLSQFQAVDLYSADGWQRLNQALELGMNRIGQERMPSQTTSPSRSILRRDYVVPDEGSPPFSTEIHYPQITPSDASWAAELNQRIAGWVTAYKHDAGRFRVPWNGRYLSEVRQSKLKSLLVLDYAVWLFNENLFSVEFKAWSYYAMAAHGNTRFTTFNFWLEPIALLELEDLFKDGSEYLQLLSQISRTELHSRLDLAEGGQDDWILRGTKPEKESFKHFSITDSVLRIVYPEYTVGPYAWGPQQISIPYGCLRELIRPDGPLRAFI